MTLEKYKRAQQIQESIYNLNKQLKLWDQADAFYDLTVCILKHECAVDLENIDFVYIRVMVMQEINIKMENLDKEFNSL